jgi:nitroreductase/ferredoxin
MGYDLKEKPVPVINDEECVGCGQCAKVCPSNVLVLEEGKLRYAPQPFPGCIGCGQCMMACQGGNIRVEGRRFGPEDLVDLPPAEARATADAMDALLLSRRSIRHFKDQEVAREQVDRILQMVSTAPIGIPPSEVGVLVIHGREKVQKFAADAVASFDKGLKFMNPVVLALMRPFLGRRQYAIMREFVRPLMTLIVEQWKKGSDVLCYQAPLAMLFHHTPLAEATDTHIATTYAMLAAESLGLGSCWIGTAVGLNHDPAFKREYGIPRENKIPGMLVVGHKAITYRRSVRRKLASVEFA